ncbi:hypothetical protein [Methanoregula sp.]|uniref:hypothetical protein n=1 Tax=Methanoregula sp. TaxID=2052170 RepID=UPI002370F234|nr:hypothetical protein [Methanoregula sp.]MDD1686819.1 hypothetical protein [Methanoregula sp.]
MGKQTGDKKAAGSGVSRIRKGKDSIEPFSFCGVTLKTVDAETVKNHLLALVALSVITKICVLFATIYIFHSFVDTFDHQYYLESIINPLNGKMPYVDFSFDYPPLAYIPIILAFIPAWLFNSASAFIFSFQVLMILCDAAIVGCIYLIGLKIYNEKTAFIAGTLYATAFAGAYFVLTKFDAFPTSLLMVAVLFTVYKMPLRGYLAATTGFLAKIYPLVAFPFLVLYNAKSTSLKQEILSALKIFVPVALILGIPVLLFAPGIISSYIGGSLVRTDVYVNTATNTLSACLNDILHLGISSAIVSTLMYVLLGLVMITLLVYAWVDQRPSEKTLIKLLAFSLFSIVFCMKYHSPQYILWFLPFVALLVADSLAGIACFYITQVLAYVEFPLLFGTLYVNTSYTGAAGSSGWYLTWLFFAVESILFLVLMYLAVKPSRAHINKILDFFRNRTEKSGA